MSTRQRLLLALIVAAVVLFSLALQLVEWLDGSWVRYAAG